MKVRKLIQIRTAISKQARMNKFTSYVTLENKLTINLMLPEVIAVMEKETRYVIQNILRIALRVARKLSF
jgi:hypothetical protein